MNKRRQSAGLNKRLVILVDAETKTLVRRMAREQETSIGVIVRAALKSLKVPR